MEIPSFLQPRSQGFSEVVIFGSLLQGFIGNSTYPQWGGGGGGGAD